MTARVGYVCTNFNNSRFTRAAVETLHAGGRWDDVRVVVVDNCSNEDDRGALRSLQRDYPTVDVVFNPENSGYFSGLNAGVSRMRELHPEVGLLVVGNNDLEFPAGFVESVERAQGTLDTWAVVAPDLVTPEGVHQNPHVLHPISAHRRLVWDLYFLNLPAAALVRGAAALTRRFTVRPENAADSQLFRSPGPVEQGYGACYLLGSRFFRHFDRFYAPTFLMQEEFFLHEQLKLIDQLTYYDPSIVVRHRGHATMGTLSNRRNWEISRRAHMQYKAFGRLTVEARRQRIAAATGFRP